MYFLGSLIALATAFLNSARFAFTKDLKGFDISKKQVVFFYRLFSLPILLLFAFATKENLQSISSTFIFWVFICLLVNILWSVFQLHIYQKHDFSSVETLSFLNILFSSTAGLLFFGESFVVKEYIGIAFIISAFVVLALVNFRKNKTNIVTLDLVFYYLLVTAVDISNKQAISKSSPVIFVVYISVLLTASFFIMSFKQFFSKSFRPSRAGLTKLALIGFLSSFTTIGFGYSYKLLPLGIVATLLSTRVFISLWISHKKYQENELKIKLLVSFVAFLGTIILFI